MTEQHHGWQAVEPTVGAIARVVEDIDRVVGVARGGLVLAVCLSHRLDVPMNTVEATHYHGKDEQSEVVLRDLASEQIADHERVLIVDDIVDTGKTLSEVTEYFENGPADFDYVTAVWHRKPTTDFEPDVTVERVRPDTWVVYPWEEMP